MREKTDSVCTETGNEVKEIDGSTKESAQLRVHSASLIVGQQTESESALRHVRECVCLHRPAVGYVQGMSYLAALFLSHMPSDLAFYSVLQLLQHDYSRCYAAMQIDSIRVLFQIFDLIFHHNLPSLRARFAAVPVPCDVFLLEWILTCFAKPLSIDMAARVADGWILAPW
jgi:hypothetical protein